MKTIVRYFFCLVAVLLIFSCGTGMNSPENENDYTLVMPPPPEAALDSSAVLPFSKGVNFSAWFEASSPSKIPFTMFTEDDFIDVKNMGADVIRLPVYLHAMTGPAPQYTLDPFFLELLDYALDWAEKHNLYLILDNHSFHPLIPTDSGIGGILIPVWEQLARRYRDRGNFLLYEILNEPHGIDADTWNDIQERVIKAIRAIDTKHSIIAGGADFNSINALTGVPVSEYEKYGKIIYTFHFYAPYIFTHQGLGAAEQQPNLKPLRGLPFPADAHAIPPTPPELLGTWIADAVDFYPQDGTVEKMAEQIDKAVAFSRGNGNVPIFCGEFGVYIPNVLNEDRVRWYKVAAKLFDDRRVARTSWDYFGSFGLFKTVNGFVANSELNAEVINALGFKAPIQGPAEKIRGGFTIYDNFPAEKIAEVYSYGCDFTTLHKNGEENAIKWSNAERYGAFRFVFRPEIDWEYLKSNKYTVSFTVKADKTARFDARFLDREDNGGIPWRMGEKVEVPADGQWHTVQIPLESMRELGAWLPHEQQWLDPAGKFSWKDIAGLYFVAEDNALNGVTLLFDTIKVESK